MDPATAWYPIVHPGAVRAAPGQQTDPRRRADRSGGIKVGEADPSLGHTVQVGSLDLRMPVAGQISVTQVVAQDNHDVGSFLLLGMNGQAGKNEDERANEDFHSHIQTKSEGNVAMKFAEKTISLINLRIFQ